MVLSLCLGKAIAMGGSQLKEKWDSLYLATGKKNIESASRLLAPELIGRLNKIKNQGTLNQQAPLNGFSQEFLLRKPPSQSWDAFFKNQLGLKAKVIELGKNYANVSLTLQELLELNESLSEFQILPHYKPQYHQIGKGEIFSEALTLLGAQGFQNSGYTGQGIQVAVIDGDYLDLAASIEAGELSALLDSVDFTADGMGLKSDHGTRVAEQLTDIAPDIHLHLLKAVTIPQFESALDYIHNQGIQVVNISMGWALYSFGDDTGPFSQGVNDSYNNHNVFWAVSAGNDAKNVWTGFFNDSDADNLHEFSLNDPLLDFKKSSHVYIKWDQFDGAVTDLDMLVSDKDGNVVASSTNRQTGGAGTSLENLEFEYDSTLAPYGLSVNRFSGNIQNLKIVVQAVQGEILEYINGGGSIVYDPSCASEAMTVGAASHFLWQTDSSVEWYSSRGPTPDGRQKPDIMGPDRAQSSLASGSNIGTSFASPHVAGLAALLLSQNPSWTAAEIKNFITTEAVDKGITGPDSVYGAGLARLPRFAPVLDSIPDKDISEWNVFDMFVSASDLNGDSLIFESPQLPDSSSLVSISKDSALFSWVPVVNADSSFDVLFVVSNSEKSDSQWVRFNVKQVIKPPFIDSLYPKSPVMAQEGDALYFYANALNLNGSNPLEYIWVFKNDSVCLGQECLLKLEFNTEGTDSLKLFVSDGDSSTMVFWELEILAYNNSPVPDSTRVGEIVSLSDSLFWMPSPDSNFADSVTYIINIFSIIDSTMLIQFESSELYYPLSTSEFLDFWNSRTDSAFLWNVQAVNGQKDTSDFPLQYYALSVNAPKTVSLSPNLFQNLIEFYPQTVFTDFTQLKIRVSELQNLEIRIYNAKGDVIEQIRDSNVRVKPYRNPKLGGNWAPGIYYLQIFANKEKLFNKLLVKLGNK